jgi:two-component system, NarL family, nitrate/nitrite response regulator NarL
MKQTETPVRIVIADDHAIVRDGLRKLLELQAGLTVVGEAADGQEAVQRARQLKPDVLLLDLAMPRLDGLGALKELAGTVPGLRIVLLTAAIDRQETVEALRLGARGVVLKESATQMLYKCIRAVMSGVLWVGHDTLDDLLASLRHPEPPGARSASPAATLTPREIQVVAAIVDGATNKDIGAQFGLSEQTVKNHVSHIFDKLGVSNRLELGLYAVHHRVLEGLDAGTARVPEHRPAGPQSPSRPRTR